MSQGHGGWTTKLRSLLIFLTPHIMNTYRAIRLLLAVMAVAAVSTSAGTIPDCPGLGPQRRGSIDVEDGDGLTAHGTVN